MSKPPPPPFDCPVCGVRFPVDATVCPSCGEELLPEPIVEPRPLWQKILIAVAIIIGVQWALILLLFVICLVG